MKKSYQSFKNNVNSKFILILIILVFTNSYISNGKWQPINSPTGGPISQLITNNNKIYALTSFYIWPDGYKNYPLGGGAYVSSDNGENWNQITKGYNNLRFITNLAADNNYLYATTYQNGIYRTSNDGATWELIHSGITNGRIFYVNNIKIINSNIYLCTNDGLYQSSDSGKNWVERNINTGTRIVNDIIEFNDSIYVATNSGLFIYDKNFKYQSEYSESIKDFYKIFRIDSKVYACARLQISLNSFLYYLYDNVGADTLKQIKNTSLQNSKVLEVTQLNSNIVISSVNAIDSNLVYKIFYSSDYGEYWNPIYEVPNKYAQDLTSGLALTENYIFAGTRYYGILKMDYSGADKSLVNNNIFNIQITSLAFKNEDIYAGTLESGIINSNDGGANWHVLDNSPLKNNEEYKSINKIVINNQNIFAATSSGIYVSKDDGVNWNLPDNNAINLADSTDIIDLIFEGSKIYAIGNSQNENSQSGYFFISSDYGNTWNIEKELSGLVYCMMKDSTDIYLGTSVGIYKSTNSGNSFPITEMAFSKDKSIYSIVKSKNNVLAGSNYGIYISKNNGSTWAASDKDLNIKIIHSLYTVGPNIFCASDSGAYFSIDHGITWEDISSDFNNFQIAGFSNNKNIIYSYLYGDAIYKSDISTFYKIEITAIPNTVLCSGLEFDIDYKVNSLIDFEAKNIFIVQLSDANGNFNLNDIEIGSVNQSISGKIPVIIPNALPFSNKYRIRIVSTAPHLIGIDYPVDLTIFSKSKPSITGDKNVCVGDNKTYSIPDDPEYRFKWIVTNGDIVGDDNKNSVTINWTTEGERLLKVILTNIPQCSDSNSILVHVHPQPVKPVITLGDNILTSSSEIGNQWFLNGNIIPNETGKSIIPHVNGMFSVQVTNEFGCKSLMSDVYNFVDNSDYINFEIDSDSAKPGENIYVNIRLQKNKKFYSSNVKTISAVFVCNSSLLYPLGTDKGVIIKGKRYIQIDLDTTFITDDIIKVLNFEAMLGDAVSTELSLEIIKINGVVEPKTIVYKGEFKLNGVCYENGTRLISSSGNDFISKIMPNPADDKIVVEFVTSEINPANFYLLNTTGAVESNLFDKVIPAGAYNMTFSLKGLSIGDHYLIMETPTSKSLYKFIISR
jgi:photosystem II stability/assembly factor-like uncharacterized protein